MPFIRDSGQFRFTPEECLTASQIKSYFSYLTRKRRKQKNDSQQSFNRTTTVNRKNREDSEESDEDIDEDADDFDFQTAAEDMADFQRMAAKILEK